MPRETNPKPPLKVCAAVIVQNAKILISRRPLEKPQGGLWEFPGGKLNSGETAEQALVRELKEELDIQIEVVDPLITVQHRYAWGEVLIMAYLCHWTAGEIKHLEIIDHAWVAPAELYTYNFLEADKPILATINNRLAKD
jgi:8-oxo-dGTP diphosphatase